MKKYNFNKLMAHNPFVYETFINSLNQEILLVEHPLRGDESFIIVVCKELELASDSCFFDCDDMLENHKEYEPSFINGELYIGNSKAID